MQTYEFVTEARLKKDLLRAPLFWSLRSGQWWFHTDVSGQPVGPILRDKE